VRRASVRSTAAALLALAALAAPGAGGDRARDRPGVARRRGDPPNGMRVIVLPRRQSPTVALSMQFLVGSAQEAEGPAGSRTCSST